MSKIVVKACGARFAPKVKLTPKIIYLHLKDQKNMDLVQSLWRRCFFIEINKSIKFSNFFASPILGNEKNNKSALKNGHGRYRRGSSTSYFKWRQSKHELRHILLYEFIQVYVVDQPDSVQCDKILVNGKSCIFKLRR